MKKLDPEVKKLRAEVRRLRRAFINISDSYYLTDKYSIDDYKIHSSDDSWLKDIKRRMNRLSKSAWRLYEKGEKNEI